MTQPSKYAPAPSKEHRLITEARTCRLDDAPHARLAFILAGLNRSNREHRALVSEYVDDVNAYDAACVVLDRRIAEQPEPAPHPEPAPAAKRQPGWLFDRGTAAIKTPATLPGQGPIAPRETVRITMPGRPVSPVLS